MLLQTNSYIVPPEKKAEHARLMRRFRQVLNKIGCDNFEVYEQVGANWASGKPSGRYVQIMRFRDRKHQLAVQNAERSDPAAQALIAEFCELVNYPYQVQQNMFAVGFYNSVLPVAPVRVQPGTAEELAAGAGIAAATDAIDEAHPGEIDAHVDAESVGTESVDPDSPEAEQLADQAAVEAEEAAEAGESVYDATLEEPTNDEVGGASEASAESEATGEALSDEDLALADEDLGLADEELALPGEDPEAGEAFEPAPTAAEELAAEADAEADAEIETETLDESAATVEPSDSVETPWDTLAGGQSATESHAGTDEPATIDEHAATEGEHAAATGEDATDFDLSEDDLAEIARELAGDDADEASRNGRGHGADPKNRM